MLFVPFISSIALPFLQAFVFLILGVLAHETSL